MKTKQEILAQADALKRIPMDTLDAIDLLCADFRSIIEEYEAKFNKVPTGDDLIWLISEKLGRDITKTGKE